MRRKEEKYNCREHIYDLIDLERESQDEKFGDQSGLSREKMLTILVEEVGEAARALLENNVTQWNLEMLQIAAVSVQILEHNISAVDL
jgi:NTP pyrophosphatase (non-canonical NTP hydrolase)